MKLKQLFAAILFVIFIISCAKETGTTIIGEIQNAPSLDVKLDKLKLDNNTMVLVSTKTDATGNFKINIPEGLAEGVYRLRVGINGFSFVIDGTESKIKIIGEYSTLKKYGVKIEGSETASSYVNILNRAATKNVKVEDIENYTLNSKSSLASMYLLIQTLGQSEQAMPLHEKVYEKLSIQNPQGEYTKDYADFIGSAKRSIAQRKASEKVKVGQLAPDIALNSPNGKEYRLSDLKGKVVLLDFWASWCGPCRKANPHVVSMYDKYNKKGFEVFSVSLDGLDTRTKARFKSQDQIDKMMVGSKNKWKAAIAADNLKWPYHVSDLKKWESEASALYGVRSIPKTFLIGRDGNIAVVNPRSNLEEVLLAEFAKD